MHAPGICSGRRSRDPLFVLGWLLLILFVGSAASGAAQQAGEGAPDSGASLPDLSEYRTVHNCITTQISRAAAPAAEKPGFLGVHLGSREGGKVEVEDVALESPAARAGISPGDLVTHLDGQATATPEDFRDILRGKRPGDTVKLTLLRDGKVLEVEATLEAPTKPVAAPQRAALGILVEPVDQGEGVVIREVLPESAADKFKLKPGEILLKFDGTPVSSAARLRELLAERKPQDQVTLTLLLADKPVEYRVTLGAEPVTDPRRGFGLGLGFDTRLGGYWRREVYRLGVILIEYPDVSCSEKIPAKAWEDAFFSRGSYTMTATGQPAYGSLADYYHEQSYGKLKVEGKVLAPVRVSKKRSEYGEGGNRFALLTEALDRLYERDGKEVLDNIDGLIFIYAGGRMNVARGSLYWPHRSTVFHQGKRWPYFICPEGGERMLNISVFAHEFGHLLGLPDLYARPENPGSEGLSVWCAMSNQAGNGRPQHFCAWAKEKLGWIQPAVIDPTVKQKLILAPIEDSPQECFKVLVRRDGSEYFLLENRRRKGFDASLPAEGLLIWRVVGNRPILEESHGVEGPAGPRVFQNAVPYPSPANDSFTPYTTPSSRSQLGGGLPVYITNIRKLPDGRITFHIGYEYH
jgi:M6 family metalloprotease-like protein